jgi:hypothetical protein
MMCLTRAVCLHTDCCLMMYLTTYMSTHRLLFDEHIALVRHIILILKQQSVCGHKALVRHIILTLKQQSVCRHIALVRNIMFDDVSDELYVYTQTVV